MSLYKFVWWKIIIQVVMVGKLFKYVKQKRVTKYLFVRDTGFPQ
jgi:hypothetical protein